MAFKLSTKSVHKEQKQEVN